MGVSVLIKERKQAISKLGIRQGNEIDVGRKLKICTYAEFK